MKGGREERKRRRGKVFSSLLFDCCRKKKKGTRFFNSYPRSSAERMKPSSTSLLPVCAQLAFQCELAHNKGGEEGGLSSLFPSLRPLLPFPLEPRHAEIWVAGNRSRGEGRGNSSLSPHPGRRVAEMRGGKGRLTALISVPPAKQERRGEGEEIASLLINPR